MTTTPNKATTLSEFDEVLDRLHMRGQWQYDAQLAGLTDGPPPGGVPFLWEGDMVRRTLEDLTEIMPESYTARRNISFINPDPGINGTTQTMVMGMQLTIPGEVAWAHRHSINALRFVVDGSPDLYTAVDGEKLVMETHDLVLTPGYGWHDHHNESDKNCVWIDILDVPLLGFLRQMFFQTFGESTQPLREGTADLVSRRTLPIRPAWERARSTRIPYRYPWSDVREALNTYAESEGSPFDGVILHYANPTTGGSTLPTIDCFVQLLRPGLETEQHRSTAGTVYYVVEGEGTTVIGGQEVTWSAGDSFVVPSWTWHRHLNRTSSTDAVLFSATDAPLLRALGFYREEPHDSFASSDYPDVPADLALLADGVHR
jgi:gentisate 1,2-dioxygenase